MVLRPSSDAKLIQPTTQPKQTNPQPNPNTTLLRTRYYYGQYLQGSTRNKVLSVGLESCEIGIYKAVVKELPGAFYFVFLLNIGIKNMFCFL